MGSSNSKPRLGHRTLHNITERVHPSGKYIPAYFTQDESKLEVLTENYNFGLQREQMDPKVRERLETEDMIVTAADVQEMRRNAGFI